MKLELNEKQQEIKKHGSFEFPMRISHEQLSWFDTYSFPLHWHSEIELTFILEGEIAYQVNETVHHLKAGDGLFCSVNALHSGHRYHTDDCHYLSVTFHPRLLYGYTSSLIQEKYMQPILENRALSSVHFTPEQPWMNHILNEMKQILRLYTAQSDSMEIHFQCCLLNIWIELYENLEHLPMAANHGRNTERIRQIVDFIHTGYNQNISLDDLADQIHLCKSETCRMFKQYMNETVFDYLLRYRIEQSLGLLKKSSLDITQVAEQVGFSTPGYYTRVFKKIMGCTPMQYRKTANLPGSS